MKVAVLLLIFASSTVCLAHTEAEEDALDRCAGFSINDCRDVLLMELRAYHNCKACVAGGSHYRANESYYQCLKRSAISSAKKMSACKEADLPAILDQNEEYFKGILGL